MNVSKVALFGGALFTAGIANAQIIYSDGLAGGINPLASSNVYNYSYNTGDNDFTIAPDVNDVQVNTTAQAGGLYTEAEMNATRVYLLSDSDGVDEGYAASRIDAYLVFNVDTSIQTSWNFANGANSTFTISEAVEPFVYNPFFSKTSGEGSEVVPLLAGKTYRIEIFTYAESFTRSTDRISTAELTVVPAPGAAALAGLAGIAAVRRRR